MLLPVWALLDGSTPVSGGRVSVYAALPQRPPRNALVPLDRRHVTSNAHGVVTLDFAHLPRTFTVVIRGGYVGRRPLRGSLSAQVHGYDAGSPVNGVSAGPVVHLNPVTTLIDAWQRVDPRISEARAQRMIDRALGIPAWADATDLRVNNQWLDGKIFLRDVRARGTLDRATGDLVVEIRTGKHVVSFRAPHRAHAAGAGGWWQDTDVGQLVKDGLSSLGVGVAEGLGVAGANWVLAKFLDAVGLGKFADFLFPITKMINQLNAIAAQVTAVKGLVEQNILATEHGQYNQLVASIRGVQSNIGTLWDDMTYEANADKNDPRLMKLNGDLIGHIGSQLVDARSAMAELNNALAPPEPLTYGIPQAASAYLGSRKPFFTQASAKAMGPVFDYYQLIQLRLSILLTNYYSTRPDTFSPTTIQDTVINKIASNIAGQRTLLKPMLPPGTFIDLRTDKNATMLMWGPVSWVNGLALEHYCVDQRGVRHRFYVNVGQLTCDPPGHNSAAEGLKLATESQFKALLDGWTAAKPGDTPLMWLQKGDRPCHDGGPEGHGDQAHRVLLGRPSRDTGQPSRSRGGSFLQDHHLPRRQHARLLRVPSPRRHAGHEHPVPGRVDHEPVRARPAELRRERGGGTHAGCGRHVLLAGRRVGLGGSDLPAVAPGRIAAGYHPVRSMSAHRSGPSVGVGKWAEFNQDDWSHPMELELKEKSTMSREDAAARLHAIADELASGNDIILERAQVRFVAKVPAVVNLKIEFEVEDDETEFEIELTW